MTDRGVRWIVIGSVLLMILALYVAVPIDELDVDDLDHLVDSGACGYVDPVSVHTFLGAAVKGTRFENRCRVNQHHDPSQLNIYIVHSSDSWYGLPPARKFNKLRRNAIAISALQTIIIDSDLLYELADLQGVERQDWGVVSYLLGWIIGHEVGHIELEHGVSHFTQGGSMTAVVRSADDIDPRELDADRVFVTRMVESSPGVTAAAAGVMAEIAERLNNNRSTRAGKPHYYFRAIAALEFIHEQTDDPELKASISGVLNRHRSP